MDKSKIEWTDATWNPIRGCTIVSDGCRNCYAMRVAHRFNGEGQPYEGLTRMTAKGPRWTGRVSLIYSVLDQPLRWRRPRRIFVNSMSDLFHESVPFEFIAAVFGVMACSQQHAFQVLTKRPERMVHFFDWLANHYFDEEQTQQAPEVVACMRHLSQYQEHIPVRHQLFPMMLSNPVYAAHFAWPLPNVWLGISVENQETANERIPLLLQTPAAVRWLSCEPMLGPVDIDHAMYGQFEHRGCNAFGFTDGFGEETMLHWVVAGGESGKDARPMHPDWARSLRDQCQDASVPFFFKQWGEWYPAELMPDHDGDGSTVMYLNEEHDSAITATTTKPCEFRPWPDIETVGAARIGKQQAGRLLDGREWNEYPRSRT